ncbi:NAD-dependent epimerase/dehydratase family protein [Glaciecola sp. KUL10]|uniref:NAD-dependent epimerase/dehydratase family protein n=1 Tax=Glaciecola sp. (strain KUL10) TaxID=2161813 RepID=UPI000D788713|nr:NAD-dependent epimerase/dehydratase family protein [Glaciecola sp. KUL10]GBL06041.1 semialdehyde dehydrogenase [Glaciecola sp. KUL10]
MSRQYTALVLGASGLVGKALVNQLCQDPRYTAITCLVRSPLQDSDFHDPMNKIQALVIDFDFLQDYQGYFSVDHVYCCLGTTIKKAGSEKAFRRVDFEFVHVAAQLTRAQRGISFVWISSVGANAKSKNFYLRVKGEVENAILTMPQLDNAAAVRPSLLLGERKETRYAEALGISLSKFLAPFMVGKLAKYKPVGANQVAYEMIKLQVFK